MNEFCHSPQKQENAPVERLQEVVNGGIWIVQGYESKRIQESIPHLVNLA
jgi:hypothetical protein